MEEKGYFSKVGLWTYLGAHFLSSSWPLVFVNMP